MRSNFLQEWAQWVIQIPEKDLRPSSKHQRQIIRLQRLITEIGETGSVEKTQELVSIPSIKCRGDTTYVAHCRYLQYCVSWLKGQNFIHLNEGKT